jgi:outer membrane receptor for monomeric catechols
MLYCDITSFLQNLGSYAYQYSRDPQTSGRLMNSPAHVAQALFSAPLFTPNVVLGATVQAVSSRITKWGGTTRAYVVPNVNLTTPLIGRHVELRFTVNNLLDHRYFDPAAEELPQEAVPQDGRTAYARVVWRF